MRNITNIFVQFGNIWSLFFPDQGLQFSVKPFIMMLVWGKVYLSGAKWWF